MGERVRWWWQLNSIHPNLELMVAVALPWWGEKMQQLRMHTVGRHRLGPEHVQNSTPETWSHPNTMRASGARALGGMFCNARITHTAKLCTKNTGAKKQQCWDLKKAVLEVLGQKSLCWTRKSHIGTLLPGDVNLHYCRQIEVDA